MKTTRHWVPGAALLVVLLVPAGLRADERAKPTTLTRKEIAEGWVLLFDGKSTRGWTSPNGSKWTVLDGMLAPQAGEPGLLVTTKEFGPCELKLQCRLRQRRLFDPDVRKEEQPSVLIGCSPKGESRSNAGEVIRLPGLLLGFVEGGDTGWIDLHVIVTDDGKDLRVKTSFQGRTVSGRGIGTRADTRAGGHIAFAGCGFIVRNVRLKPLGRKGPEGRGHHPRLHLPVRPW